MDGTGRKPTTPAKVENPEAAPKLPLELAAKVDGLPAEYQEAVAELVAKFGPDGLSRIAAAVSAKRPGRRSYDQHNEPLLRRMGALLHAHPSWKVHKAAEAVMRSAAGAAELKRSGGQPGSLVRRLTDQWKKHGPRVMREVRQANQKAQFDAARALIGTKFGQDLALIRDSMPALRAALPGYGRQVAGGFNLLTRAIADPGNQAALKHQFGEALSVLRLVTDPAASKAVMERIAPGYEAVRRLMDDPKSPFGRLLPPPRN